MIESSNFQKNLYVRGMGITYVQFAVSNFFKNFGGGVDTYGIVTALFTEIGSFLDIKQNAYRYTSF